MEPNFNFDYNNVSEDSKNAVKAVLLNLEVAGKLTPEIEKSMKVRFGIEDPEMISLNESKFYQLARNFGIHCSEEGFTTDMDNGRKIPNLRISGNVIRLDAFLEFARINLNTLEDQEAQGQQALEDADRLDAQASNTTDISAEEIQKEVEKIESTVELDNL
tara:strand:+ start:983 stop:1465 length:483 start_codon:yes stop_codon:yes gene_type:complete